LENIGQFIGALTLFFGSLGATAWYLINRLKNLERDNEQRRTNDMKTLKDERDQLRTRVTDLEEQAKRVPKLEERLDIALGQIKDLNTRLEKTERALEAEQRENERLRKDNDLKDKRIIEQDGVIAMQKNTIVSYEKIFMYIGTEREKMASSGAESAPQPEAAEQKPERGEQSTADSVEG